MTKLIWVDTELRLSSINLKREQSGIGMGRQEGGDGGNWRRSEKVKGIEEVTRVRFSCYTFN